MRTGWKKALRLGFERGVLEAVLLLVCVALAVSAPAFLTLENLLNVLRSVSEIGIIAFGMTMVIIAGEIDLSVGSMVAFAGCLTAYIAGGLSGMGMGIAIAIAIVTAVAAGALLGCVAGIAAVNISKRIWR